MLLLPLYTQKLKLNFIIIFLLFIFVYPVYAQSYANQSYYIPNNEVQYNTNYPSIDRLEKKVFGQISTTKNIYERLNALESKVFKETYNIELSSRVERLQHATGAKNQLQKINIDKRLNEIENHIFNNSYSSDSTINRIARIEKHYFGKTYPDETPSVRMDRIYTVLQVETYKAQNESVPNDVINKTSDGVKVLSIIMFMAGLFL